MLDDPSRRVGTFISDRQYPIHSSVKEEGVEVIRSVRHEEARLVGGLLLESSGVDTDKYTASVEMGPNDGYFIRTLPGVKTNFPVQACLYLSKPKFAQNVHISSSPRKIRTAYYHRLYDFSGQRTRYASRRFGIFISRKALR